MLTSTDALFAKRKRLRLPWQEPYEPIQESQSKALLDEGKELGAKAADQSDFVPVRSHQDLEEFESFRHSQVRPGLEEPEMASALLKLRSRGAKFMGGSQKNLKEIGAYGAYNFLSGEFQIDQFQIVFGQAIPTLEASNKSQFDDLVKKAEKAEQMIENTRDDLKQKHWSRAFSSALDNPQDSKPLELAIHTAYQKMAYDDWSEQGQDLGLLGEVFSSFKSSNNRIALAEQVLSQVDADSVKKIKKLESAIQLMGLASAADISDERFYAEVSGAVHKDDLNQVSVSLGEALFPEKFALAKNLVASSPSDREAGNLRGALDTILANPELSDPKDLAAKALEASLGSEDQAGLSIALSHFLYPERSQRIDSLVKYSPPDQRMDHELSLFSVSAEHPDVQDMGELIGKLAESVTEDNWDGYRSVNGLYLSLLKQNAQEQPRAALAARVGEAKKKDGKHKIQYAPSQRSLFKAALDPNLTPREFFNRALEGCEKDDRQFIAGEILEECLPERHEALENILRFANVDEKKAYFRHFLEAAISAENLSPAEFAQIATTSLGENPPWKNLGGIKRLAAKQQATSNDRSAQLVAIADELTSRGKREIQQWNTVVALYDAALDTKTSPEELFDQIVKTSDDDDKKFVRRAVAESLFPKLTERVSRLTSFSSIEEETQHWDALFQAQHQSPGTKNPGILTKKAADILRKSGAEEATITSLWSLAAKEVRGTNARASRALDIALSDDGEWNLATHPAVQNLYKFALQPHLSEVDHLVKVTENADEKSAAHITRELGGDLLDELGDKLPQDIRQRFENGELPLEELVEVYETYSDNSAKPKHTEIKVEEDLILIGNETLEVDI